jgi:hypothetical protein
MADFTQACGPFRDDFALRGGPQHRTEGPEKGPVWPSPPVGGEASNLHPQIDPEADVQTHARGDHAAMTLLDYLIDSALVLLVLVQLKERPLTTRTLVRPIVILAIAVASYFHGIPTAGNDLVLVGLLALLGGVIGVLSGRTVRMRRDADGRVVARAGWASAVYWVLGMGSRFAFLIWINNGGRAAVASFSSAHAITSGEAWTAALLGMAVFEVLGRTAVLALRRQQLESDALPELA